MIRNSTVSINRNKFESFIIMNRCQQSSFDFHDSIVQPTNDIQYAKNVKTKLIKDLNHKALTQLKSQKYFKFQSVSKEKDHLVKKQRPRRNSSVVEIDSLLEKAIPGARITKGQWKDHKLHGQVIIEYQNGNVFEGKYQNNLRVEGKMVYKSAKCEYEGSFFSQKFSGYGKLTYYEGRIIEGEWDNMGLVGNATITYPNEDVYYGPVDQKLYKHGQGYLFLKSGYKYIGSFKSGSITGVGSYYKDQKLVVKGVWHKGKLMKEITNTSQESQFDEFNTNSVHFNTHTGQPAKQSSITNNLRFMINKGSKKKFTIKPHHQQKSDESLMQSSGTILNSRTGLKQYDSFIQSSRETQRSQ